VPFGPGSGADSASRVVAQSLSERLKQPIVIENRPGAGGNIGAEIVSKAAPDGYTLLVGSNGTHAANAALYSSLPFDPQKDFVPISYIGSVAMVLLAPPTHAASGAQEVLEQAKARPGQITIAIPSSTARVVLEQLHKTSGARFNPVAYKGSGTAMSDLMGGHVQLSIDTVIAATPHVTAGKLKPLAVSSLGRSAALPQVPSFHETGLQGFDLSAWNVWFAPRGTPQEVVANLNEGLRATLADADVQTKLRGLGYKPSNRENPQRVTEFVRDETQK